MFPTTIHNNNQRVDEFSFPFINNSASAQTLTLSVADTNIIYDDGVLINASPSLPKNRFEYKYGNTIYSVKCANAPAQVLIASSGGTVVIKTHKKCMPSNFNLSSTSTDSGLINMNLSGFTGIHVIGSSRGISSSNKSVLTGVTLPHSDTIYSGESSTDLLDFSLSTNLKNIDMSGFHGIGGYIQAFTSPSLSALTLPTYIVDGVLPISRFYFYGCALVGPIDLSVLTNLGGSVRFHNNPLIGSITWPLTTNRITDINLSNCGVGYIDLKPLSGYSYTIGSSITIAANTNSISKTNMNHLLVDLDNLGWGGGTLTANSGNNGYDGTSGGYDGITARLSLLVKGLIVTL